MFPKIIAMLAPIGAALAFVYSSLTGYSIMREIGSRLRDDHTIVLSSGHLVGSIGLLLFGIGVTAAALSPRTRSTPVICLFIGGMIAFGLAAFLVGFGNWQLSAAIRSLATAKSMAPESFIRRDRMT